MTAEDKIEALKPLVNYDSSAFVKETLSFPFDFYRAIEYAIRKVGKEIRVYERTFYFPINSASRLYNLDTSKLTADKLDYVKTIELGLVSVVDTEQKLGLVNREHLGNLEVNKVVDRYALARQLSLQGVNFKSNSETEGYPLGEYNSITGIAGTTITPSVALGAPQIGYYVINLSLSNAGVYSYTTVATVPGATFTTVDNMSTVWTTSDKIYVVSALVPMIVIVAQCIPQMGYVTDKAVVIPIMNQFIDDIDHFCVAYLYRLLSSRDPKQAQVYMGMVNSKLIKSEDTAILDIRKRAVPDKPIEVERYNPFGNLTVYGR